MDTRAGWLTYPGFFVGLLFLGAVIHGGPQYGLLILSFCLWVAWIWITRSIARLNLDCVVRGSWLSALAIAYLVWLLLNPFLSTYPYASFGTAMQLALLPLVALGWLIVPAKDEDSAWQTMWRVLLLFGAVLAAWGLIDFVVLRQRAHGPLIDANAYAALINLFLVPLMFRFLSYPARSDHRASDIWVIALFAFAQFMSMSRGGLIALIAILPVLFWFARRNPFFRTRSAIVLLALGSAYFVVKLFPVDPDRSVEALLLAPGVAESDIAVQARLLLWKSTWEIVQDSNIVVGTGLGTFTNYYVAYRDPQELASAGFYAHNDYLQSLQEGGIVQVAFLLGLTIFVPIALLRRSARDTTGELGPGLLLAVICVALHAAVNFIHLIAPISVLTGLYLARGWKLSWNAPNKLPIFSKTGRYIKPTFAKGLVIALLGAPVALLTVDAAISGIFDPKGTVLTRIDASTRFSLLNSALSLRPSNPIARVTYIQDLLNAANRAISPTAREQLLSRAEREAELLSAHAPALASGRFFRGLIRAVKGGPTNLMFARDDLEFAVRRVPPATKMRLALIKVYQALGQHDTAYLAAAEAKKWLSLESDKNSLAAFAREAQILARGKEDRNEEEFWAWVEAQLASAPASAG